MSHLTKWQLNEVRKLLRDELRLEIRNLPERHCNEPPGPVYLCLVLGEENIGTLDSTDIKAVLEQWEDRYTR